MSSKLPIQSLTRSRWGWACKLCKLCQLLKDPGLYISQRSSMKLVLFVQTAKCHVVDPRTFVPTFTVVSSCVFFFSKHRKVRIFESWAIDILFDVVCVGLILVLSGLAEMDPPGTSRLVVRGIRGFHTRNVG